MQHQIITQTLPNGTLLEMIHIEGDSFMMGSGERESEQPIHDVNIPSFYMGQHPITNEQFVPFLNEQGNQEEGGTNWVDLEGAFWGARCGILEGPNGFECVKGLERHPMIYVSWYGAHAYCEWLSAQTGEAYRLPSEAEWEYAAKGGAHKSPFQYSGSNHLKEVGWCDKNSHRGPKPVGMKLANELGLYDMSGNVWEWCADHWHENYKDAPKDGSAWVKGGDSNSLVVRGGSWDYVDNDCRVSVRDWDYTDLRSFAIGFRLAWY